MNYSDDPSSVRVDFFRPSGKWYTTEAVKMDVYYASPRPNEHGAFALIHDAFRRALAEHLCQPDGTLRLAGTWAVCLEPHHEHAHPLMVLVPERG